MITEEWGKEVLEGSLYQRGADFAYLDDGKSRGDSERLDRHCACASDLVEIQVRVMVGLGRQLL